MLLYLGNKNESYGNIRKSILYEIPSNVYFLRGWEELCIHKRNKKYFAIQLFLYSTLISFMLYCFEWRKNAKLAKQLLLDHT